MASLPTGLARRLRLVQRGDRGSTATEYAMLVGFIAVAIALGITAFGTQLDAFFNSLASALADLIP